MQRWVHLKLLVSVDLSDHGGEHGLDVVCSLGVVDEIILVGIELESARVAFVIQTHFLASLQSPQCLNSGLLLGLELLFQAGDSVARILNALLSLCLFLLLLAFILELGDLLLEEGFLLFHHLI